MSGRSQQPGRGGGSTSAKPVVFTTGIVSQVDDGRGVARCTLPDLDNLETYWLQVLQRNTKDNKVYWMPDVGDQVMVIADENLEDGCILGAVYSEADTPPVSTRDKYHVKFKDGSIAEFDRKEGAFTIKSKTLLIECSEEVTIKTKKLSLEVQEEGTVQSKKLGIQSAQESTINNKAIAVIGGIDSDGDTLVQSGQGGAGGGSSGGGSGSGGSGGGSGSGSGGSGSVTSPTPFLNGESIGALRVVCLLTDGLRLADSATVSHAFRLVGLSLSATASGALQTPLLEGIVKDAAWNWNPSIPLWLGTNGQMTQTSPTTGFLVQVATAIAPDQIYFQIQEPILL